MDALGYRGCPEETFMTNLGFIGLGNMGLPMATRLRAAGHALVVQDARHAQAQAFAAAGGTAVRTAREVGDRADLVFASLPTPQALADVVGGADGLARGTRVKLLVDLSTTGPKAAIAAAEVLGAHDIGFIDAPVSGGISGAAKGTLAIMASGTPERYEQVRPLLEQLGKPFRVGDGPGQGQAMKLLNNLLSATAMAATTEAMVLGVKAGLDPRTMLDVFNAGSGRNTATTDKFPRSVIDRSFAFGFRTVLLHKDVRLARQFADDFGTPFEIGRAVDAAWERAAAALGDEDFTRIVEVMEQGTGVTVGSAGGDGPR